MVCRAVEASRIAAVMGSELASSVQYGTLRCYAQRECNVMQRERGCERLLHVSHEVHVIDCGLRSKQASRNFREGGWDVMW